MAVASVHTIRVKPGRIQDFQSINAEGTKILERLGARVRVWRPVAGGEPASVSYVLEYDDMKQFGEFSDKLQSDSEWQALVQRIQSNPDPATEPVSNVLITDLLQ